MSHSHQAGVNWVMTPLFLGDITQVIAVVCDCIKVAHIILLKRFCSFNLLHLIPAASLSGIVTCAPYYWFYLVCQSILACLIFSILLFWDISLLIIISTYMQMDVKLEGPYNIYPIRQLSGGPDDELQDKVTL